MRVVNDATFWSLIELLDWDYEGDDDRVVEPLVAALAELSAEDVHAFQEVLAAKLYALDGRAWTPPEGMEIAGEPDEFDIDPFLETRCVAIANGRDFYERVLREPSRMPHDREFGALFDVVAAACERAGYDFEGDTAVSAATFSNRAGWGLPGVDAAEEETHALSLGAIMGLGRDWRWEEALRALSRRVRLNRDVDSPLNVNVVFQMPGDSLKPEFAGTRTGTYSRKQNLLMVQAAVPLHPVSDADAELLALLALAIDEAELFARRRKIAQGLPELRSVLALL